MVMWSQLPSWLSSPATAPQRGQQAGHGRQARHLSGILNMGGDFKAVLGRNDDGFHTLNVFHQAVDGGLRRGDSGVDYDGSCHGFRTPVAPATSLQLKNLLRIRTSAGNTGHSTPLACALRRRRCRARWAWASICHADDTGRLRDQAGKAVQASVQVRQRVGPAVVDQDHQPERAAAVAT